MRAFLVNPPAPDGRPYMKEIGRCGRRCVGGELWPQTGLAYLAAVLREQGIECRIYDGMVEPRKGLKTSSALRKLGLTDWPPDLVIVHTTTPTFHFDAPYGQWLHEQTGARWGLVGTHGSALPVESLEESGADFVIVGEAEHTLAELAENLQGPYEGIDGLVYRTSEGTIRMTPPREPVESLDSLPFPARDLLPNAAYRMPFLSAPFATVIPTRGCPHPCTFCRAGTVWGRRVRKRSPENILAELHHLRDELGITRIAFMADSLTEYQDWFLAVCRAMIEDQVGVTWVCNSRLDTVDSTALRLAAQAGCKAISFGVESGEQEILDRARKGISLLDAKRTIAAARKAGLFTVAYFMIGLPSETAESVQKTIELALDIEADLAQFHTVVPFPGTVLFEEAQTNGWLRTRDWRFYEETAPAVMRTEALTCTQIDALRRRAVRSFYLRPRQLLHMIRLVRELGGWRRVITNGLRALWGR